MSILNALMCYCLTPCNGNFNKFVYNNKGSGFYCFAKAKFNIQQLNLSNMSFTELLLYSEEDRKEILSAYDRTFNTVQNDIEVVKEWFKRQQHLPETPTDKFIENFLLLNKFEMEKTKEKLDMYYTVRTLIPDMFEKAIEDPEILATKNMIYMLPLPQLTKELQRVVVAKLIDKNPDHFNPWLIFIYAFSHIEIRLRKDCNASVIYVYDLDGLKSSHLIKCTPNILRKIQFISQKVITNRLHAVHLINVPSIAESFISLCKTFLKPKVSSKITIHANLESFQEVISREILPVDFGGLEKSLGELNEQWKREFLLCSAIFKDIKELRVNEELRAEKLKSSDLFGLEGNFRQLSFD